MTNDVAAVKVLIIGGGFGGIAMGVRLKRSGIDDFVILEQNAGPGGTWWSNDYPNSEVDVVSSIYSYSFKLGRFSRTHAGQAELLEYIKETVDEFGLTPHFRYNTRVDAVVWDDARQSYTVTTRDGRAIEAKYVVSAVGMLSDPRPPSWPGTETFEGRLMHSSQWDHSLDLSDKTVGVIGVGSTGAQIIPGIAPKARELKVFMREPGWVLPKHARDYTSEELRKNRSRLRRRLRRNIDMVRNDWHHTYHPIYLAGSKRNVEYERVARRYLDEVFKDRPDLKEAMTPTYQFSAKRRVVSDDFLQALTLPNVELITGGVVALTKTGVVSGDGRETPVDVLVYATGFKASQYLSSLKVSGRDGALLSDVWKDGAFAFLGITVPRFPNFFIMYGPNTNGGAPITRMLELQARFIAAEIRRAERHGWTSIEVTQEASDRYQVWIQRRMEGTAWQYGNNYFKAPNGKIVTQWRDGAALYSWLLRTKRLRGSRGRKVRVEPAASVEKPERSATEAALATQSGGSE